MPLRASRWIGAALLLLGAACCDANHGRETRDRSAPHSASEPRTRPTRSPTNDSADSPVPFASGGQVADSGAVSSSSCTTECKPRLPTKLPLIGHEVAWFSALEPRLLKRWGYRGQFSVWERQRRVLGHDARVNLLFGVDNADDIEPTDPCLGRLIRVSVSFRAVEYDVVERVAMGFLIAGYRRRAPLPQRPATAPLRPTIHFLTEQTAVEFSYWDAGAGETSLVVDMVPAWSCDPSLLAPQRPHE